MINRSGFSMQYILCRVELILLVMFFSGVLVLVNYIAFRHNTRFDLTPDKTYSLSPRTENILSSLSEKIVVTVFYKQKENADIEALMELFAMNSNYFHYSLIDLEKNPAKAEMLGIKNYGAGTVEYRGRKEKVRYLTEENLVIAIISLTEKSQKIVRFIIGHGEKDISSSDAAQGYSMVKEALESENYSVSNILLMQTEKIPGDTSVLIAGGPKKDFFKRELEKINDYLQNGGHMIFLCDPSPLPEIEKYLQTLNIRLARDFVIDKKSRLLGFDNITPIVTLDKTHPLSEHMNEAVVFPVCRSVTPVAETGIDIFAMSGPDSWSEIDTQTVYEDRASFDKNKDIKGPVPVAVATAIQPPEDNTRSGKPGFLIVMGNSNFAANHYFNVLGNRDLFLNTVNWLTKKKPLLSTRPRTGRAPVSMLFLTENDGRLVLWSSVIIQPGIILLAGIIILMWRRRKR